MTGRIEKTVFISYRRTNFYTALAVYQDLTQHGYDVFFDFQSIDSGDFEKTITENIKAKAHFLIILSPSALERCSEPEDWLRREIEMAMDEKRNIVPLMMEGFDFGSPSVRQALSGKLSTLNRYNGLRLVADYFFEAMEKLRGRFLNVVLQNVSLYPVSAETKEINEISKVAADEAAPVEVDQLTAEEWNERGYKYFESRDIVESIRCHSEAIRLDPRFAFAHFCRGYMMEAKGDLDAAIEDYNKAIQLESNSSETAMYYCFRGGLRGSTGDISGALADFGEAIFADPKYDFTYYSRAWLWEEKEEFSRAITDYQKYIELIGEDQEDDKIEVEEKIRKLKRNLARKRPTKKRAK